MRLKKTPPIFRLWIALLLGGFCMVAFSARSSALTIGENYGGGIVFYLDGSGRHGLVAAREDIEGGGALTWSEAYEACRLLTLNGYRDWRLPTRDELNRLYLHKKTVGGFASAEYWSSSRDDSWKTLTFACSQDFQGGIQISAPMALPSFVRPVRAF